MSENESQGPPSGEPPKPTEPPKPPEGPPAGTPSEPGPPDSRPSEPPPSASSPGAGGPEAASASGSSDTPAAQTPTTPGSGEAPAPETKPAAASTSDADTKPAPGEPGDSGESGEGGEPSDRPKKKKRRRKKKPGGEGGEGTSAPPHRPPGRSFVEDQIDRDAEKLAREARTIPTARLRPIGIMAQEIRRMAASGHPGDAREARRALVLMKSKVAFLSGREQGRERSAFVKVRDTIFSGVDALTRQRETPDPMQLRNFLDHLEAFVGYHRFHSDDRRRD